MKEIVDSYMDYLPVKQRQRSKRIAKVQSMTKRVLRKQLRRIVGKIKTHIPPQPAYESELVPRNWFGEYSQSGYE